MQGRREGGPAACYTDRDARRALLALLDDGFPGLSLRIEAAHAEGFAWDEVTEPFVAWQGDQAVGHVGVLEHRIRLDGRDVLCAGIHAVVTRSDQRHRGIARRCLREATAWIDARYALSKLGTDLPAVYAPHGFRPVALHKFAVDHTGGEGRGRSLRDDDRAWLLDLLPRRTPVSDRFASLDPGWLVGIDLALQRRTLRDLVVLDDLGVAVDWQVRNEILELHDVFATELPPLSDLLARAPAHKRVELYICPDRLAPNARPIPIPEAGVWMVRGEWPLPDDAPFALSRLAEH